MGTRALIGVQHADGTYQARHVGLDGYPTSIVPFLAELVHITCNGDTDAAITALLRTDWLGLGDPPPTADPAAIGVPLICRTDPETGTITTTPAGDRQWAYLFDDDQLRVYLALAEHPLHKRWHPWAAWPIADLPQAALAQLPDLQRRGNTEAWLASDRLQFLDAMRDLSNRYGDPS